MKYYLIHMTTLLHCPRSSALSSVCSYVIELSRKISVLRKVLQAAQTKLALTYLLRVASLCLLRHPPPSVPRPTTPIPRLDRFIANTLHCTCLHPSVFPSSTLSSVSMRSSLPPKVHPVIGYLFRLLCWPPRSSVTTLTQPILGV